MRAVKIPGLEGGSIGSRMESRVNSDGPISMVPCLHQGNIYTIIEAMGMERPEMDSASGYNNPPYLCRA